MTTITSRANGTVRATRALCEARARREQGLHLVEGEKLVREAAASGAGIARLFVEEGFPAPAADAEAVYTVSRSVMEALCESRTPQHVCAAVRTPGTALPASFPAGLIIVLDRVQDAGNVGTILRTADAFGASGVLLGAGSADPYSGKALRAAMGSTYHLPLWQGETADALDRLQREGFCCLCGHLVGDETPPAVSARMALVIGNEGNGVSDAVTARCTLWRLPMRGRAESLNAAVAAALMIYELSGRMASPCASAGKEGYVHETGPHRR